MGRSNRRGGRYPAAAPRPAPRMRRHGATGQAFARWKVGGRDHTRYFGAWGSAAAREAYGRFVAEWAAGATAPPVPAAVANYGVAALLRDWLVSCRTEYVKFGRPTTMRGHADAAARAVSDAGFGALPAAEFGPDQFRAVRAWLVALRPGPGRRTIPPDGLSLGTVRLYTSRIRQAFKWAAGRGLVSAVVPAAIREVEPLKPGRTSAPVRPRRQAADPAHVAAAVGRLDPLTAAAVRLQQVTGMRAGEVSALRPCDLDTSDPEWWVYTVRPEANKNHHRGQSQVYDLGPRARAILAPLVAGAYPAAPVFGMLTRGVYGYRIRAACDRAGVPRWSPHQLRHLHATRVADHFDSLDAAAAAIGDTPAVAGRVYVHVDLQRRMRRQVARELG